MTDLEARTDVRGLFAVGEVAMTGVHGAEPAGLEFTLGSGGVCASGGAELRGSGCGKPHRFPKRRSGRPRGRSNQEEWVLVEHNRDEIRKVMWDYVGIVRSMFRLERAQRRMKLAQARD